MDKNCLEDRKMHDWQQLTDLTQNKEISIERVRIIESGIAIDGDFELPPLARLNMEDQIFVAAFVKSHGSIKDMEELYGVSYPSIKNRLKRISKAFDFIDITPADPGGDILEELDKGNISFDQAMEALKK
jgi:hypothetical protein